MELWNFFVGLLKSLLILGIVILVLWILLAIVLYIITSYLMDKHSRIKYGKSTILVWIPIVRLYYLGKEVYNDYLGYGLIILRILFLLDGIGGLKILFLSVGTLFKLVVYGMFIYLYSKMKELEKNNIKVLKTKKEK